jgi:hypothetical protein
MIDPANRSPGSPTPGLKIQRLPIFDTGLLRLSDDRLTSIKESILAEEIIDPPFSTLALDAGERDDICQTSRSVEVAEKYVTTVDEFHKLAAYIIRLYMSNRPVASFSSSFQSSPTPRSCHIYTDWTYTLLCVRYFLIYVHPGF